jgi:plastocyanin
MGVTYVPKCVRVSAGTEITFESNFTMHPLVGGPIENGIGTADPTSPITRTDTGASATFTLADPGERPYFCENHSTIGMFGTVYVE